MLYNYLKTPTSISIWTNEKTYLIGVDDLKYNDVLKAIEKDARYGTNDWSYIAALLDPSLYELDDEEDSDELE
jgi:hypothetical protein